MLGPGRPSLWLCSVLSVANHLACSFGASGRYLVLANVRSCTGLALNTLLNASSNPQLVAASTGLTAHCRCQAELLSWFVCFLAAQDPKQVSKCSEFREDCECVSALFPRSPQGSVPLRQASVVCQKPGVFLSALPCEGSARQVPVNVGGIFPPQIQP